MAQLAQCELCPSTDAKLCSTCKQVRYCGQEHQKQHWLNHEYKCYPPSQMGLCLLPILHGSDSPSDTPVFLPRSTGSLTPMEPHELFGFIPGCSPSSLQFRVVPLSTYFDPEYTVVVAYNQNSKLDSPMSGETVPAGIAGINMIASRLVRDPDRPHDSPHIYGPAILFYLHPGKHFNAQPDHQALISALDILEREGDRELAKECLEAELKEAPKLSEADEEDERESIQIEALLWPAMHDKPRIIKVSCLVMDDGEDEEGRALILHSVNRPNNYVGSSTLAHSTRFPPIDRKQSKPLIAYFRDNFQFDGSPENESIMKATEGKAAVAWKGNVLILRQATEESAAFVDVQPEDVEISKEWFKIYGKK